MKTEYLLIIFLLLTFIMILIWIGSFRRKLTIYGYNKNTKYKLIRDHKRKQHIYEVLPLSLKNEEFINKYDFYARINQNLDDRVMKFIDKILNDFDTININLLLNNINNVKINKLKLHSFNTIFSSIKISNGEYNIKKNEITYYDINNSNNLEHELFHLATSKVEDNFMCSGFYYYFKDSEIGYGLNEGYTQLLSNRCFPGNQDFYYYEKSIAFMIEDIIGKEKLIKLYFKADLKSLIDELSKYSSTEEAINLIIKIDCFSKKNSYENINNSFNAKAMANLLKDIQINILKISYSKKNKLNVNYIREFNGYKVIDDIITNQIINGII
ncbi:MAG: hypothetical protein PHE54_05230 [Bacilli bacterium]|nr:hypothetical protein [Bacilli bacterium]